MTGEAPEQCPVCHDPYAERERHDSSATLNCPTHSRICVQRYGTALDVYRHERIPLKTAPLPCHDQ